jgi:hypothetical protein
MVVTVATLDEEPLVPMAGMGEPLKSISVIRKPICSCSSKDAVVLKVWSKAARVDDLDDMVSRDKVPMVETEGADSSIHRETVKYTNQGGCQGPMVDRGEVRPVNYETATRVGLETFKST